MAISQSSLHILPWPRLSCCIITIRLEWRVLCCSDSTRILAGGVALDRGRGSSKEPCPTPSLETFNGLTPSVRKEAYFLFSSSGRRGFSLVLQGWQGLPFSPLRLTSKWNVGNEGTGAPNLCCSPHLPQLCSVRKAFPGLSCSLPFLRAPFRGQ